MLGLGKIMAGVMPSSRYLSLSSRASAKSRISLLGVGVGVLEGPAAAVSYEGGFSCRGRGFRSIVKESLKG